MDGERALLPMSVRRGARGLVRSYHSSAAGTYGGWLTERPLSDEHADTLSNYLAHGFDRLDAPRGRSAAREADGLDRRCEALSRG